jgi:hypothetical protein
MTDNFVEELTAQYFRIKGYVVSTNYWFPMESVLRKIQIVWSLNGEPEKSRHQPRRMGATSILSKCRRRSNTAAHEEFTRFG